VGYRVNEIQGVVYSYMVYKTTS
jgi:hypothetical protein